MPPALLSTADFLKTRLRCFASWTACRSGWARHVHSVEKLTIEGVDFGEGAHLAVLIGAAVLSEPAREGLEKLAEHHIGGRRQRVESQSSV
jgi:hypothetical protein